MNSFNLIVASSPLQVLMSLEAVKYYGINKEDVELIFIDNNRINKNSFFSIINFLGFERFLYFPRKNFLLKCFFLKNRIKWRGKGNNIIHSGKEIDIVKSIDFNRNIIIGDGIEILSRLHNFSNKINKNNSSGFPVEELFIPYQVDVDNLVINKNNFDYLNSINLNVEYTYLDGCVLFIGGYYSEIVFGQRIFDFDHARYIEIIENIMLFYKENGLKLLYVPHHYECSEKLQLIRDLGVEIFENHGGIEINLILKKIRPVEIAAFHSSALYHIKLMFPEVKVKCFLLDLKLVSRVHYNIFNSAFDFYKKQFECYQVDDNVLLKRNDL